MPCSAPKSVPLKTQLWGAGLSWRATQGWAFTKGKLRLKPRKILIKEVWFMDHVSELRDCIIGMAEMAILRYRSVTAEVKGR